jgi:NADH:ubiquinone oxidoreductase subunit 2 (subunit N)
MYMREPETVINPLNPPPAAALAVAACMVATILLGLFPQPLLELAREGAKLLL